MKKKFAVVAIAATGSLLFVACGDDDDVESATEDFCSAVAEVGADVEALRGLNAESSVDDAQAAVSNLEDAVQAARSAADDLGEEKADAVESAFNDMQSTIDDIDDSETLGDAATQVVQARDTFLAEYDEIRSENCVTQAVESATTTT